MVDFLITVSKSARFTSIYYYRGKGYGVKIPRGPRNVFRPEKVYISKSQYLIHSMTFT